MARFLFSVHLYPPKHNCGGESFIHNLAKYLISKGHECRVLLHQANTYKITQVYEWEGVLVFPPTRQKEELFHWANGGIFTHLEYTDWTIEIGRVYKKPVFFIVHNTSVYNSVANEQKKVNVIYNSNYARDLLKYPHPSIVLHPPVDFRKYNVCENPATNEYITIINYNVNKGGWIFKEIAKHMPDKKFLAVKGSYLMTNEKELIDFSDCPNVTVWENSPDILPAYRQTRILLMPSEYESWGMCATEAMCSGIPVISSGTFGLRENCAEAGIYVDRENIEEWVKQIKRLDGPRIYKLASERSRKRSIELDPMAEYAATEQFILNREQLHVAGDNRRY